MGFKITPDDLENLPDHTAQLEALDAADIVDAVLPRHLGDAAHGRFVIGFMLVAGDRLLGKTLVEDDSGEYNFQTVYETDLDHSVDIYGDLWNRGLIFQWSDRTDAQRTDLYIQSYSSHFTLGYDLTSELIEENVEGALQEMERAETPVMCSEHPAVESAYVEHFDVNYQQCSECGHPLSLVDDGVEYDGDDVLSVDWIDTTGAETGPDGRTILPVDDDSPRRTRLALHYATWLGRWETSDFDVYINDRQGLLHIEDGSVIGYLLWGRFPHGRPVLHQVYVRPAERGEGSAFALLDHWYEEHLDEETYDALRPNEAGERFLRSAEHLGTPGDSRAVPVTAMNASDQIDNPEEIEPAATIEGRLS